MNGNDLDQWLALFLVMAVLVSVASAIYILAWCAHAIAAAWRLSTTGVYRARRWWQIRRARRNADRVIHVPTATKTVHVVVAGGGAGGGPGMLGEPGGNVVSCGPGGTVQR